MSTHSAFVSRAAAFCLIRFSKILLTETRCKFEKLLDPFKHPSSRMIHFRLVTQVPLKCGRKLMTCPALNIVNTPKIWIIFYEWILLNLNSLISILPKRVSCWEYLMKKHSNLLKSNSNGFILQKKTVESKVCGSLGRIGMLFLRVIMGAPLTKFGRNMKLPEYWSPNEYDWLSAHGVLRNQHGETSRKRTISAVDIFLGPQRELDVDAWVDQYVFSVPPTNKGQGIRHWSRRERVLSRFPKNCFSHYMNWMHLNIERNSANGLEKMLLPIETMRKAHSLIRANYFASTIFLFEK